MIIIYGSVLIAYFLLYGIALKHRKSEKRAVVQGNPFDCIALFLYKKMRDSHRFSFRKVRDYLAMLYPGSLNSRVDEFYIKKISLVLLLVFAGDVFALFLYLSSLSEGILADGKYIQRNTYGLGSIEADLQAQITDSEMEYKQDFNFTVSEREYEKDIVIQLAKEVSSSLPGIILGDNISPEEVRGKLNLPGEVEDYPFRIEWDSDNYGLIYTDGTVNCEEVGEDGEIVNLTAVLIYGSYREEHVFAFRVCPPIYSKEELLQRQITEALGQQENISRNSENMKLPESVEGEEGVKIQWRENKEDYSFYLFILAWIGAVSIYVLLDNDLDKRVDQRNKQLLLDYSGVVSKLTLYMGAGMTIRNAFYRTAQNYKKRKEQDIQEKNNTRYVYEEMLITCYELDSGIPEATAYEKFGKRCGLSKYMKLSNLLIQNLKKGSNCILTALQQETISAFEERKNVAKKLGEEAGTKLLFPMMLMLGIIMILIIIPAYFSFSI